MSISVLSSVLGKNRPPENVRDSNATHPVFAQSTTSHPTNPTRRPYPSSTSRARLTHRRFFFAPFIVHPVHKKTRRPAQTGNMARKGNVDSDGPSTADVSANEDVEMQDQDTKMSGFKKFGVSATHNSRPLRDAVTQCHSESAPVCENWLTMQSQYYQDTPDYTVCQLSPPILHQHSRANTDPRPGLRYQPKHHSQ